MASPMLSGGANLPEVLRGLLEGVQLAWAAATVRDDYKVVNNGLVGHVGNELVELLSRNTQKLGGSICEK